MREELRTGYFEQLGKQEFMLFSTYGALSTAITAGEIYLAPNMLHYYPLQLQEEGAPIDQYATSPMFVSPRTIGVLSEAPHPNAAKLLVNFILSEKGQMASCGIGKLISANPNIRVPGVPVYGEFEAKEWTLELGEEFIANIEALREEWASFFKI